MVSGLVVGVWDGLEECEISLPEMCYSVTIQSLANKILNVSYFVCQYVNMT